jgi:hypothetical protein
VCSAGGWFIDHNHQAGFAGLLQALFDPIDPDSALKQKYITGNALATECNQVHLLFIETPSIGNFYLFFSPLAQLVGRIIMNTRSAKLPGLRVVLPIDAPAPAALSPVQVIEKQETTHILSLMPGWLRLLPMFQPQYLGAVWQVCRIQ